MDHLVIARLAIGEEALESIKSLAIRARLPGAAITGLGAVNDVTLALYDLASRTYATTRLVEDLEVSSLTGNLSWVGEEPVAHLHAVVSRADGSAAAGHVMRAVVSVTLELMLTVYPDRIRRAPDAGVGLNLLDLTTPGGTGE